MFKIFRKEIDWGGRKLVLETGRMARQADGAVLATYGDTVVLCTAVGQRQIKPGVDFFPLTVNYQEKTFAAGKIPGGFFKREGRPSEKEVLTSRLIDRPIRPLFAEGYRNETQVICTTLSHDLENDPDIVAMIGASAARRSGTRGLRRAGPGHAVGRRAGPGGSPARPPGRAPRPSPGRALRGARRGPPAAVPPSGIRRRARERPSGSIGYA